MYFLSYVSSKAALHIEERIYETAPLSTSVVPSPKKTVSKIAQALHNLLRVK